MEDEIKQRRTYISATTTLLDPLSRIVMKYEGYHKYRHTMSPLRGHDNPFLFYWPCCESRNLYASGCKLVLMPICESDGDYDNPSLWTHEGVYGSQTNVWHYCCYAVGLQSIGCKLKGL